MTCACICFLFACAVSVYSVFVGLDAAESLPLGLGWELLRSNNWALLRPKPAAAVGERMKDENEMIKAGGNISLCLCIRVNVLMHYALPLIVSDWFDYFFWRIWYMYLNPSKNGVCFRMGEQPDSLLCPHRNQSQEHRLKYLVETTVAAWLMIGSLPVCTLCYKVWFRLWVNVWKYKRGNGKCFTHMLHFTTFSLSYIFISFFSFVIVSDAQHTMSFSTRAFKKQILLLLVALKLKITFWIGKCKIGSWNGRPEGNLQGSLRQRCLTSVARIYHCEIF